MGFTPFPSHGSHPEADPEMWYGPGPLFQDPPDYTVLQNNDTVAEGGGEKESWVTMKMVASRDCFACSKEEITARLDLSLNFRGFVCQNEQRVIDEGTGHGGALLFHRRRSLPGISPEWRRCRTPGTAGQRAAPWRDQQFRQ